MLTGRTKDSEVCDPWVTRMWNMPATVVSRTLKEPLDWPNAGVVSGDAVDVVARLKEKSEVPLRSHGNLSMNRALMAANLVDYLQVTLFPVITGQTGLNPILGASDFDLELIEHRTLTVTPKSSLSTHPALRCRDLRVSPRAGSPFTKVAGACRRRRGCGCRCATQCFGACWSPILWAQISRLVEPSCWRESPRCDYEPDIDGAFNTSS